MTAAVVSSSYRKRIESFSNTTPRQFFLSSKEKSGEMGSVIRIPYVDSHAGTSVVERHLWRNAIGALPETNFASNNDNAATLLDYNQQFTLENFANVWNALYQLSEFHAITDVNPKAVVYGKRGTPANSPVTGFGLHASVACEDIRGRGRLQAKKIPAHISAIYKQTSVGSSERQRIVLFPPPGCAIGTAESPRPERSYAIEIQAPLLRMNLPGSNTPESRKAKPISRASVSGREQEYLTGLWSTFFVPMEHVSISIDGQKTLVEQYDGAFRLNSGPFDKTFPNLDRLLKQFDEINIASLEIYRNQESDIVGSSSLAQLIQTLNELNGQQVSLLGVTAPGSLIRTWGGTIIASIMLYFIVHIRAFTRNNAKDFKNNVPWIGAYNHDTISKALLLVTSVLLPIGVAGWLAYDSLPGLSLPAIFAYLSFAVVAGLAIPMTLSIRAMWRALPGIAHGGAI